MSNMVHFVVLMKIIFGVFTGSLKSLAFAAPLVNAFFYDDNYSVTEEIIIMIVVYYLACSDRLYGKVLIAKECRAFYCFLVLIRYNKNYRRSV